MKNEWKNTALKKQLQFKKSIDLTKSGFSAGETYAHILDDMDALALANFYCFQISMEEQLDFHAWVVKDKPFNFTSVGLKNMLRSEHIPYNFFFPLEKLRKINPQLLNTFIEQLLNNTIKVDEVTNIKIEFAGGLPKRDLLDDLTSFDAYIAYKSGNNIGGIGIEVKYTEESYPYGKTEYKRMFELVNSEYVQLTKRSGYFKDTAIVSLRTKKLKQPWRNHLLGIKMVEVGTLNQFHSVHLYPKANNYQNEVCSEYQKCLKENHKNTFIPLTFERFIEEAERVLGKNDYINQIDWIGYLKNRY